MSLHWLRNLPSRLSRGVVDWYRRATLSDRDREYASEVDFWDEYLSGSPKTLLDPGRRRAAFPQELRDLARDIAAPTGKPRLLEIGSGPTSLLAAGVEENLFELVAVDPLADVYAKMLARRGIDYPVHPIVGTGENLLSMFEPATFDVVYSSNALDHTVSPAECLAQICAVLRPGGTLMLEGFVREGSAAHWEGLHQHDLYVEGRQLVREDREGNRSILTATLPLAYISATTIPFRERGIATSGYEVPDGISEDDSWEHRGWYKLLLRRR